MKLFRQPRKHVIETLSQGLLRAIAPLVRREGPVLAKRRGLHVLSDHYYSPIPSPADVAEPGFFDAARPTPGLDIDAAAALERMGPALAEPLERFRAWLAAEAGRAGGFSLLNGSYMALDAHLLYAMTWLRKPAKVVEIGAGASSAVIAAARAALTESGASAPAHVCVEPYPNADLRRRAELGEIELMVQRVQDAPLSLFTELGENDILFIDSSHVAREASDVLYEYLQILPSLQPGVIVHIHDIYLPKPYPKMFFDRGFYWNEQYLLQAYLIGNGGVEALWPTGFLMHAHREAMIALFPELDEMWERYPNHRPSCFWMRTR